MAIWKFDEPFLATAIKDSITTSDCCQPRPRRSVYFQDEGGGPLIPALTKCQKRPADPSELTEPYTDEAIGLSRRKQGWSVFSIISTHDVAQSAGLERQFQAKSQWGEYGDSMPNMDHNVGHIF